MPIYEYRCQKCQCDFELFIWSARDEENLKCPKCQSTDVKRQLSAFRSGSKGDAGVFAGGQCGPSSGGFS